MNYTLPKLPYSYDALVPYIDAKTMEIHYTKHHQGYVDKLNAALKNAPQFSSISRLRQDSGAQAIKTSADMTPDEQQSLQQLIKNLDSLPIDLRVDIQNQGGGHLNHTFFWNILTPKSTKEPIGNVADEIKKHFGMFSSFQERFNKAAQTLFGSGWAWLVITKDGSLKIVTTQNQDNPISRDEFPILGLDVWEHAYYLSYQNRRPEYILAWWQVVNWEMVEQHYQTWLNRH